MTIVHKPLYLTKAENTHGAGSGNGLFSKQGTHIFFDIATLREPQFTGIPYVAANLAKEIIQSNLPCSFFIGENIIRRDFVEFLLASGSGSYFAYHHQLGQTIECGLLQRVTETRQSIGLFPAEKPFHRLFDFEVQIVHDLSTITTPYFHTKATNELHGDNLLADIESNDLNICVSHATAAYLQALTRMRSDKVVVAHNGVRWPEHFSRRYETILKPMHMEDFVVILGTLEPRKNLEVVFQALALDRNLVNRYKYVFLGKAGWLLNFDQAVVRHLGQRPETFLYPGYVSDFKKYCLLRRSAFTIYPSLYEGFGLPILESHSLGVPAAYSHSTSMPEVGNGSPYHFDPLDADSLLAAIYRIEADRIDSAAALHDNCLRWANKFSWHGMLSTILAAIAERIGETAQ